MAEHTPEPWHHGKEVSLHDTQLIYSSNGRLIADAGRILGRSQSEMQSNARRICAAVNSVAGIPTESLESGVVGEMLAALVSIRDYARDSRTGRMLTGDGYAAAEAAINKAKGV